VAVKVRKGIGSIIGLGKEIDDSIYFLKVKTDTSPAPKWVERAITKAWEKRLQKYPAILRLSMTDPEKLLELAREIARKT
jgi:hypothetical protein